MAARQDHTLLLDQLQEQVNLVLENTGRLFAAVNANPKVAPVAQSTRLRHVLPGAVGRFHDALDRLEDELQLAKAVMRRDLAVWREKTGHQVPEAPMKIEEDLAKDTAMQDISTEPAVPTEDDKAQVDEKPPPNKDVPMEDTDNLQSAVSATESKEDTAAVTENTGPAVETTDVKPLKLEETSNTPSALHLNTTQPSDDSLNPENSDDKPPDTTDLDSLFNDPLSASGPGTGNDGNTEEAGDGDGDGDGRGNDAFNFDANSATHDFDFDSFSANLGSHDGPDNDNIESLIPGLHDYANANPTSGGAADFDFNALFGGMDEGGPPAGMTTDGEGAAQRDTAIDDMLNMAGDFDGGAGGNAGDGDGSANDDLDFDSLFNS